MASRIDTTLEALIAAKYPVRGRAPSATLSAAFPDGSTVDLAAEA